MYQRSCTVVQKLKKRRQGRQELRLKNMFINQTPTTHALSPSLRSGATSLYPRSGTTSLRRNFTVPTYNAVIHGTTSLSPLPLDFSQILCYTIPIKIK